MKKIIFLITLLVFTTAFIGQARQWTYGNELIYHINVINPGTKDADNLRLSVFIPDLVVFRRTNRFDVDDGDNVGKFIFEPLIALPGYYITKITLSSSEDGILDTKYIYTII